MRTTHIKVAAAVISAAILGSGCSEGGKKKMASPAAEVETYSFGSTAALCGDIISLGALEASADAKRTVNFQIAVCGTVDSEDAHHEWKALGATLITDQVRLVGA